MKRKTTISPSGRSALAVWQTIVSILTLLLLEAHQQTTHLTTLPKEVGSIYSIFSFFLICFMTLRIELFRVFLRYKLVNPSFLDAILRLLFVRKEEKSNASGADADSGLPSKNFKIIANFEISFEFLIPLGMKIDENPLWEINRGFHLTTSVCFIYMFSWLFQRSKISADDHYCLDDENDDDENVELGGSDDGAG